MMTYMKKLITLITAILFTTSISAQQTESKVWDFTLPLSEIDYENLQADKEYVTSEGETDYFNWYRIAITSKNTKAYRYFRYGLGQKITDAVTDDYGDFVQLYANRQYLDYTRGLYFGRYDGFIGPKMIRIEPGSRLNTNCSNLAIKIPNLKAKDVVRIKFSTGSTADAARYFELTNGTVPGKEPTKISSNDYKNPVIATITVTKDGDLTMKESNGMYIYAISVNKEIQ